jgi:hypothetical protein
MQKKKKKKVNWLHKRKWKVWIPKVVSFGKIARKGMVDTVMQTHLLLTFLCDKGYSPHASTEGRRQTFTKVSFLSCYLYKRNCFPCRNRRQKVLPLHVITQLPPGKNNNFANMAYLVWHILIPFRFLPHAEQGLLSFSDLKWLQQCQPDERDVFL